MPKSAGSLRIRVVGELAVECDGRPLPLPASKKTRALFGYLVVTGTAHPRQRLCDLLWDTPDDPRAALRWSLTKIRPLLEMGSTARLVTDRERVGFEAGTATVDHREVQALLAPGADATSTESLERCASLLEGELLEGLEMIDCYRFHEWCVAQREHVRGTRATVLDTLVARLADEPERALVHARTRVALDPLADVAHARVVTLLGALGRRAEALAQAETCRRIRERELGGRRSVAIDLALAELGAAVTTANAPEMEARIPPSAPVAITMRAAPPVADVPLLVGRDAEVSLATELVDRATRGEPIPLWLLEGEPGIGKTRILRELARTMGEAGGIVLWARAFEAEGARPFGMWSEILAAVPNADIAREDRARLAPLLSVVGAEAAAADGQTVLFDATARTMSSLGARQPVVLLLDDIHFIDEASAALLHHVMRACRGARVLVAASARVGELADNPAALRLVRALRRDAALLGMRLERLDDKSTRALAVAAGAEGELRPDDLDAICRESGGNPLFAVAIAKERASGRREAFGTLDDHVDERLARLSDAASDRVVWAAVLGRTFDPALLARVCGATLHDTLAAVGELETEGLLVPHADAYGPGRYQFAHDLIREATYRSLSEPRRRLMHLQVARTLAAEADIGARVGAFSEVVHHATLGGDGLLAARACLAAAEECTRLFARARAVDLVRRGLAQLDRVGQGAAPDVRADLLCVAAFATDGRSPELEPELEAAVAEARRRGAPRDEAVALRGLMYVRHRRDDFEATHVSTLAAAEAARAADGRTTLLSLANAGFCLTLIERDMPRARALLDEADELSRRQRKDVSDLAIGRALLLAFEGAYDPARAALEAAAIVARAEENNWFESVCLTRLAMMDVEVGAWDAAAESAEALAALATRRSDESSLATAAGLRALSALGRAEPGASTRVDEAAALLEQLDSRAAHAHLLTTAAGMALAAGDLAAAEERASRALASAQTIKRPSAVALARAVLARCAGASGRPDEAVAHAAAAARELESPHGVSARARAAVASLERSVSTLSPTGAPTRTGHEG